MAQFIPHGAISSTEIGFDLFIVVHNGSAEGRGFRDPLEPNG